MRSPRIALVLTGLALILSLGVSAGAASATTGLIGGLDLADYCANLGYQGTTATGPAELLKGGITGHNFAYGNWACVANDGTPVPITPTGGAPSMLDACHTDYVNVATYAIPDDPDNAYSWNCYLLPPAAGTSRSQQITAAVSALMSNDAVQAEIATMQDLISNRHVGRAIASESQFLAARSTTELVTDVLGAYGLTSPRDRIMTRNELGFDIFRAAFHL